MLTELLIASFCASSPFTYQQACNKASEATAVSFGIVRTEKQIQDFATAQGRYYIGDSVWTVGGVVGGLGLKLHRDHELSYRFNTKNYIPAIDFIAPTIKGIGLPNQSGGSLGMGWSW